MTNNDLQKQYNYFQNSSFGHKLTCLCGSKLTPTVSEPNFYLQCPDCDWIEPQLPKIPTIEKMKELEDSQKEMMNALMEDALEKANQEPEQDLTETRKISYTVTFEVTETLEFDPADWDEDMQTMDEYQAYEIDSLNSYSEELFEIISACDYTISDIKEIK